MKISLKTVVLILIVFVHVKSYAEYSRGLHFCSFEVDQDKRTGLNLTPERKLDLPNGFSLQFDIQLRNQEQTFGYIFRIIGNDSLNLDLVSDISSNENIFSLVSGRKSLLQVRKSDLKNFTVGSWAKITLSYIPKQNQLNLKINDWQRSVAFDYRKFKSIDVFFGLNRHSSFSTTDVPPMTIRDIYLYNENTVIRNWKLEKHVLNKVYDECQNQKATCYNPIWEIDNHVKWQQKAHLVVKNKHPQFAFDSEAAKLFIVKDKFLGIYNVASEKIDSVAVRKGIAFNCMSNQLVFDKKNQNLISYSFDNNSLARFDFKTREWSNDNSQLVLPQFWHHTKYYDSNDSTLITMGGYGYHKYKSDVMRYSVKMKEWKQHDISADMSPRYLGSMGYIGNDEVLFFGGYGSKTGNQEEFPQNYYDLYKINIKTLHATKLWEMKTPQEQFTNANSLIYNKEKNVFYNLTYSNTRYSSGLRLLEISCEKPEYKEVGDSIPYKFRDVESYCDLYYCPGLSKLLAVTSLSKNNTSEINIYSIAYPPMQPTNVLQMDVDEKHFKWYYYLIIVLLFSLLYFLRNRIFKKKIVSGGITRSEFAYSIPEIEQNPSSINLLGNFHIFDKDGTNITANLSPTITHILVLIILYSVKNTQGISTQELTDILWYDKDSDSARNNRNVNMSKLRLILKNVGNIELVNNNSYWLLNFGKEVSCDYKNVMYLIDFINKQRTISSEIIGEFLSMASKGTLLPNLHEEWFDDYKGAYTNSLIETLTKLSCNEEIKNDFGLLFKISEIILLHDNIDEDAAKLKVFALYNLGKKGQAKQYYEKFLDNYRNIMADEYKESFEQFLNRST